VDWLHFYTYSVLILAALMLAAAGLVYLLALPRKAVATWWQIATLGMPTRIHYCEVAVSTLAFAVFLFAMGLI